MLRAARLVAGKDLLIERRSRVATMQIVPVAVLVLVLFAFALDPARGTLRRATPGLFWVAVLLVLLLAVLRTFAVEHADGARDALRLADLEPAGIFLGKAAALALELLAVEVVLLVGVLVLYDVSLPASGALLLVATCITATVGLTAVGTLYGGLAAGLKVRETLLPLLVLPVAAPVLIGATTAFEAALDTGSRSLSQGWSWVGLLTVFGLAYTALGLVAFGPLLEEA
jgi:heme exporter protein B